MQGIAHIPIPRTLPAVRSLRNRARKVKSDLKRLGLEQLISFGFGLVLLAATVAGVVSIRGHIEVRESSAAAAKDAHNALLATQLAMLQQREQATSRAFFLNPAEHGDQRCIEAAQKFAAISRQLRTESTDPAARDRLADVTTTWEAGESELATMFAFGRQGNNAAMLGEMPKSVALSKKIQTAVTAYVSYMEFAPKPHSSSRSKLPAECCGFPSSSSA